MHQSENFSGTKLKNSKDSSEGASSQTAAILHQSEISWTKWPPNRHKFGVYILTIVCHGITVTVIKM